MGVQDVELVAPANRSGMGDPADDQEYPEESAHHQRDPAAVRREPVIRALHELIPNRIALGVVIRNAHGWTAAFLPGRVQALGNAE